MKRKPTEENKALFGYKKDGKLDSNCIKCRIINQKYKQNEIVNDNNPTTNGDIQTNDSIRGASAPITDPIHRVCSNDGVSNTQTNNSNDGDLNQIIRCTKCSRKGNKNDFSENGRTYKTCQVCRQKVKNKLIERKEAIAGGSTMVCNTCEIEKDVKCFTCNRTENKLSQRCRDCKKEAFEKWTIEREAKIQAQERVVEC